MKARVIEEVMTGNLLERDLKAITTYLIYQLILGRTNGVTPIELISLINRIIKSNEIEIGAIDIRESYSVFEIDVKAENDLIKKGPKIDFNGVSLDIKKSKEKIERKFQRDKKNKSNFKSKRSYGGSQRDFKGRSDRRSKSKGRYNN